MVWLHSISDMSNTASQNDRCHLHISLCKIKKIKVSAASQIASQLEFHTDHIAESNLMVCISRWAECKQDKQSLINRTYRRRKKNWTRLGRMKNRQLSHGLSFLANQSPLHALRPHSPCCPNPSSRRRCHLQKLRPPRCVMSAFACRNSSLPLSSDRLSRRAPPPPIAWL